MRALLQRIREKGREGARRIVAFIRAEKTCVVTREAVLVGASALMAWGGWNAVQVAIGNREGFAENILPDTLPLLLSGVLYIDRFAAVFGVILAATVLLIFLERARGAFWRGVKALVLVLGVISASTPLTLVAWLVLATILLTQDIPQKSRRGFTFSMGAIALSVLVLSGGAFLAEMTIVATVSSQLPPESVLFALVLLFAGSLWSIRSLSGAYFLIPAYIALRLCLFFLGTASAPFLTLIALIALLAAKHTAFMRGPHAYGRASLYLLFVCIPLTMMGVELQVITAVQCFLFGGIAIAASGILADTSVRWPLMWQKAGTWIGRFAESPLPGTLFGGGALLVGAGFVSLSAATTGILEMLYILLLAVLTLATFVFMSRILLAKEAVGASGVQLSGLVQTLFLLAGGVGFAQVLALLGTTIGGDSPDATIAIEFAENTFSFTPWIFAGISAVVIALLILLKKKREDIWERLVGPVRNVFAALDARCMRPRITETIHTKYQQVYAGVDTSLARAEDRITRMTLQESGVLVLAYFVITLIVLF